MCVAVSWCVTRLTDLTGAEAPRKLQCYWGQKESVTGGCAAPGGLFPSEQVGSGVCIQACPKTEDVRGRCRLRILFPLRLSALHKDRRIPSNLTQLWTAGLHQYAQDQ